MQRHYMDQGHDNQDRREAFVGLLMRHDRVIRAYLRSMLPSLADVDDLMQEVSIAAWRGFEKLDAPENFRVWACGIARIEYLRFRRNKARNRIVLGKEVEQLIADEGIAELTMRQRELEALEACVQKLPDERKHLVFDAYAGDRSMKTIAEAVGKTPDAVYQIISRVRRQILKCIEKTIAGAH